MTPTRPARLSICLAVMLILSAAPSFGQRAAPTNPDSLFLRLENQLMTAVMKRNRTVMETMISDDYKLTSSDSNGGLISKRGYINGSMDPDYLEATSFEFLDLSAEMIRHDVAIVRSRLDWKSTFRGAPWNARFLMTDIWTRSDGAEWRLLSRHSSYPAEELPRIVEERYR